MKLSKGNVTFSEWLEEYVVNIPSSVIINNNARSLDEVK